MRGSRIKRERGRGVEGARGRKGVAEREWKGLE